jgi:polyhydroxyalkanoate synthesis repressor PhaR
MAAEHEVYRIKKYPNRRFYDTSRSRHVTLDELYELVRQGHSIQVTDSNTGEDISNVVLTQMILERDPPKLGLFPAGLLHQVIQANQQILHSFVERYFSRALEAFLQSQQQFEEFLRRAGVPDPGLMAPLNWARSFMPGAIGGGAPPQHEARAASRPRDDRSSSRPRDDRAAGSADARSAEGRGAGASADQPPFEPQSLEELRAQLSVLSRQLEQLRAAPAAGNKPRPAAPRRKRPAPRHGRRGGTA